MPPKSQTTNFHNFEVRGGAVIVTLEAGADRAAVANAVKGVGFIAGHNKGVETHDPLGPTTVRLTLGQGVTLDEALTRLAHTRGVRSVEPDYVVHTADLGGTVSPTAASDDPGYLGGQAWGLYGDLTTPRANTFGSQAGEAWTAGHTGSTNVVVGLLDTGLDYTHVDLYLNVWLNPNEIPTALKAALVDSDGDGVIGFRDLNAAANAAEVSDLNANGRIDAGDLLRDARWEDGLDQDGNGYTDDLIGWDFLNEDNDPFDDVSHGTHVGGTIAAQGGNAAGAAGVTWSTQLIVAKFLGPSGGFTSDAVQALNYVTALSAAPGGDAIVATNNSWGGGGPSQALLDAIVAGAQADLLFIAAAGNGGSDAVGDNNDVTPQYPSSYDTTAGAGYDAVISVASLVSTGALSPFSNYGAGSVDLGAPGSTIYSTLPGGAYGTKSGTSMATGFVTGAVALYVAANPGATAAEIRADLLSTTTPTASLAGKTVTGGRLDVSVLLYKIAPDGVVVTGTAAADTLSLAAAPPGQSRASIFNDTLSGGDGADKLDGGPGVDRMVGGAGNDTYTADSAGDVIVELANEGVDLLTSSVSQVLGASVEKLTLTGTFGLSGAGNELDNTITGNTGANDLSGGGGHDTLTGGGGGDTLIGGAGNDKLAGGTEVDSMTGGAGDDSYDVDVVEDVVVEVAGEGNDLVNSTISYVLAADLERLTLIGAAAVDGTGNAAANILIGNGAANVLVGDAGDDTVDGKAGADSIAGGQGNDKLTGGTEADTLSGGAGNDTYYVDAATDVVTEGLDEGLDWVSSTASFTLGDNIEMLTLTGAAAISGTGNGLANTLTGNTGANLLDGGGAADTLNGGSGADTLTGGAGADSLTGGAGADSMAGGAGDDTYSVDALGDVVTEAADEGLDLVLSSVTFILSEDVEHLTLSASVVANGGGNGLANVINGSKGANVLAGAGGSDTLVGNYGTDTLNGGAGIDVITGGRDADRYVFDKGEAAGDTITDFSAGEKLELRGWGAGSTLIKVTGSLTNWRITDGVTGETEVITLSNKYNLLASDWLFA